MVRRFEKLTREKIEYLWSQSGVFITTAELEERNPIEPPISSLELTVANFKGKELDPIIE